jgi:hypothetical protein
MQHVGSIAIVLFWIVISYILYKWGMDSNKSISDHVAAGKQFTLYTPSAFLYLILMGWFLYNWLLPHTQASRLDYVLLGIGLISLVSVFSVPRRDKLIRIHDRLTTILGITIFVLVASLSLKHLKGGFAISAGAALLSMLLAGTYLLTRDRKSYLQTEVFYFAMFHFLVLLLTYTS